MRLASLCDIAAVVLVVLEDRSLFISLLKTNNTPLPSSHLDSRRRVMFLHPVFVACATTVACTVTNKLASSKAPRKSSKLVENNDDDDDDDDEPVRRIQKFVVGWLV